MKTYLVNIVVEEDDDAWRAYAPELESQGAATWGKTREEALVNIQEVVQMVIGDMLEDGDPLPPGVSVSEQPVVAVSV